MGSGAPRVKICGVTTLADAQLAVTAGAWALGMIFYPDSPRRCSVSEAERIAVALRRQVQLCGVFVNAGLDEVTRISERVGLSMLQLHGDEGPAFCHEARRRTGTRVMKAVQLAARADVQALERFHTDLHLVDGRARGLRGGTGEPFDWSLLAHRRSPIPLVLSGGLTAENVAEAIRRTEPYAVDSASGTESEPGRKDPERLARFFDQVRATGTPETEDDPARAMTPETEDDPARAMTPETADPR
ncbi:MAG TPA: phosphoribosylanthranilate isomerase [Solirubrobacteraceae bacterium]|jgi:phosphoribosylanthranilate isomerase|nr:phosphoribosylanthranilate isomerase [Solirubrobacteraceae bacterium]